ncbi:PH domain-containing protein [Mangrovihabitans endophyticus]|uniref:Low molecular weight protein antigen 6 PH domain-containing protein n=1 Tax=Mangrovihabitans endophyticus TaxID=1751298 RepID=A0A8J3BYW1_9ACTN|nr:PH domain-containing protein [Mangrovihabitans endophyticus]GGK94090.1 hypothetical protein GCM10012284_30170 [Mangrovihabitans endophyticus]
MSPSPEPEPPSDSSAQPWQIKPVIPVTKGLGAVAVLVLVFAFGRHDIVQWCIAGVASAGLAIWALRDLVAPIRLAADAEGLTLVTGYAGRRHVGWAEVERLRLDRRERFGMTTSLLEVDTGDNIYLFGMHDLGAEPADVLDTLSDLRSSAA